jgi:tetratricopeptide (TPR) repeat protein
VPADSAYSFSYSGRGLERVPIPILGGRDVTYTTTSNRSTDYFFHIPDGQRPWITALNGEGKGMIQTSTARLKGRKLFLWGRGPGGKRWQAFLAKPGHAYLEIQAGLARTQAEHVPMPANTTWEWLEAYGLMEADPDTVHGSDWSAAGQEVEGKLNALIPLSTLNAELERGQVWRDRPPTELFQRGSGWGALERLRREKSGEPPFSPPGLIFDGASLDAQQDPWLDLLNEGALGAADPKAEPTNYVVQAEWRALLEEAVQRGQGAHWASWLHLGLMRYAAGERDTARRAWERSLELTETPWAKRNLAVLAQEDGQSAKAVELYAEACRMLPSYPLAVECGKALIAAGQPQKWLDLIDELPETVRAAGRIRLMEGQAALATNEFARIEQLFTDVPAIDDLREGEVSLSQLWFEYHEQRLSVQENVPIDETLRKRVRREHPVPAEIDFRMHTE